MNKRTFGNEGEQAACDYLTAKGWQVINRNVRRGRGEIDIIAQKGALPPSSRSSGAPIPPSVPLPRL